MKSKIYLSILFVSMVIATNLLNAQTPTCNAPSGLNVNNITATSVTVNWNAVTGAIVYNLRYRVSPSPNNLWQSISTTATNINISNLLSNQLYEYQVQTGCSGLNGAITLSPFSSLSYFTTLPGTNACAVPTGLVTTNITATSAKVNWSNTGATSYKLRYRQVGTTAWTSKTSTSTFKNLTGLIAATSYQWQVRSVCVSPSGVVVNSAFSAMSTFQTIGANACPVPSGLNTNVGGVNGITLGWNSTGAVSYNVRYRPLNTLTWITTTSTVNSKVLTGLLMNTSYEWQVQSACGINGAIVLSAWSASSYFTSLSPIAINPNPANDKIFVTVQDISTMNLNYTIRDLYGVTYLRNSIASNSESNQFEINISSLRNGFYFLELNTSEGIKTQKFYVQN